MKKMKPGNRHDDYDMGTRKQYGRDAVQKSEMIDVQPLEHQYVVKLRDSNIPGFNATPRDTVKPKDTKGNNPIVGAIISAVLGQAMKD